MAAYLERVARSTSTRFWVNNPTLPEADSAIARGAVGSTTNPAFMSNLLKRAPHEIHPVIETAIARTSDDDAVADLVQLELVARLAQRFAEIHEDSEGRLGFVSIQGGPATDHDAGAILHEALAARGRAPNIAPKIPATAPGLAAMQELVRAGHPCIVTEVFSLAQLSAVCERHAKACARLPSRPPLFISPITGIFSDHLRAVGTADGGPLEAAHITQAGVVLSRACQKMVDERGYGATLLAGGARVPDDFLGLVGGGMHATINLSTADELDALEEEVVERIHEPVEPATVAWLTERFADVRTALDEAALSERDFGDFPPVLYFRGLFSAGWDATLAAIDALRHTTAGAGGLPVGR